MTKTRPMTRTMTRLSLTTSAAAFLLGCGLLVAGAQQASAQNITTGGGSKAGAGNSGVSIYNRIYSRPAPVEDSEKTNIQKGSAEDEEDTKSSRRSASSRTEGRRNITASSSPYQRGPSRSDVQQIQNDLLADMMAPHVLSDQELASFTDISTQAMSSLLDFEDMDYEQVLKSLEEAPKRNLQQTLGEGRRNAAGRVRLQKKPGAGNAQPLSADSLRRGLRNKTQQERAPYTSRR